MRRLLFALYLAAVPAFAFAQADEVAHPDPQVEARLKAIAGELRCLVCQNETLANSNATLALDLRNQIRGMIAAGQSDDEIRTYLVDRYGDFVLYRPPFKPVTVLLWAGPFALLAVGAGIAVVIVRRRRQGAGADAPAGAEAQARRAQVAALLDSDAPPSSGTGS